MVTIIKARDKWNLGLHRPGLDFWAEAVYS